MASQRRIRARKSLNVVSASIASAQHEVSFLPSQQVSRGNYPAPDTRGTGKDKFIISNEYMKWPNNPNAYQVNNEKLGLTVTTKLSRCPQCYAGPYANLTVHRKTCPCKSKEQQEEARQRMIKVTNGKRQATLNSILRTYPPKKKTKPNTPASSSSSSSHPVPKIWGL